MLLGAIDFAGLGDVIGGASSIHNLEVEGGSNFLLTASVVKIHVLLGCLGIGEDSLRRWRDV